MKSTAKFLLLIVIATFLSIGCQIPHQFRLLQPHLDTSESESSRELTKPTEVRMATQPAKPSAAPSNSVVPEPAQPAGFLSSDCSLSGITFENITTAISNSDPFNGPYMICDSIATGGNGLNKLSHIDVHTVKPEFLNTSFEDQKGVWKPIIDDAVAWKEKNPTVSTEVIMIRDDENGYIYMVLTNANVQGCLLGEGYGSEIIDSYLVNLQFSSCEGTSAEYLGAIKALRDTARKAIERINKN